ncbi:MAG TPA: hypothetical protein VF487_12030 [Chitinophagaceae bacterium]
MKFVLILLLSCLFLNACKKEELGSTTLSGNLVNTDWYLVNSGFDVNNDGAIEVSNFSSLPACEQDDYLHFNSNSILHIFDNSNRCAGRPQRAEEFFSVSRNDTCLYVRQSGYFVIKKLTSTELHLRVATRAWGIPSTGNILYYYEKR